MAHALGISQDGVSRLTINTHIDLCVGAAKATYTGTISEPNLD